MIVRLQPGVAYAFPHSAHCSASQLSGACPITSTP